jgi:hypothetical protein
MGYANFLRIPTCGDIFDWGRCDSGLTEFQNEFSKFCPGDGGDCGRVGLNGLFRRDLGPHRFELADEHRPANIDRFSLVLTDTSSFRNLDEAMYRLYRRGVGMFILDSSVDCSTKEGLAAHLQLIRKFEVENAG